MNDKELEELAFYFLQDLAVVIKFCDADSLDRASKSLVKLLKRCK
jgi:hypothetical protein